MTDDPDLASRTFDGTGTPPEGLRDVMIQMIEKRLDKTVDWSVCNVTDETVRARMLETDAKRMLLTMSTIKNRDKGFANVLFDKEAEKVSSAYVMWPNGAQLLKTHGDAMYCGSITVTSKDPHVLMIISVIDRDARMRLAALGITRDENKSSWSSLFGWVKERVPQFDPKCIVTNDDLHVHYAFEETLKPEACHVICYRRKFMGMQLKTIVWANNTEGVKKKYEDIKAFAVKSRLDESIRGRLPIIFADKFFEERSTLPVFTGDFLCQINPVMKCLKDFILPDKFDVFYTVNAVRFHRANDVV